MKGNLGQVLRLIRIALAEDYGRDDITTRLCLFSNKKIKAVILTKESGVICGLDVARLVFKTVDKDIVFSKRVRDGQKVTSGKVLARIKGEAGSILQAERVALNFLAHLCGIATKTSQFVQRVKPYSAKIMDTRKTTPGLRTLEKYAVSCGGGLNHRMGLWDQVLIKDNHIRNQNLKQLIENVKSKIPPDMKLEVEVSNLREFQQALLAKPDIIMLDNFKLADIKKAVNVRRQARLSRPELEASGGISLANVRKIAACGVERISVGELTHSVRAMDMALNCE